MSYERDGMVYESYGAYLRSKSLRVGYCQSAKGLDSTRQKRWDAELNLYKSARDQGIQPAGTKSSQIRKAFDISDRTGRAFDASAASGGMP